jgi:hypothetical protein
MGCAEPKLTHSGAGHEPDPSSYRHRRFRGIGAALAKRLAADGLSIVVNYAGSAKEAQSVVDSIKAANGGWVNGQTLRVNGGIV